MTENDYNEIMIHRVANNQMILSVNDHTESLWDLDEFNKVQFMFVQYDQNGGSQMVPIYIDANDIYAVMQSIMMGQFRKTEFDNAKKPAEYRSYGGSKSGGQARIREGGSLVRAIDGTEARIFTISYDNGRKRYYLRGEAYEGRVTSTGAITKSGGEPVVSLYFTLSREQMLKMAAATVKHLTARHSAALVKRELEEDAGLGSGGDGYNYGVPYNEAGV